ncbi:biotin transporter BioY [Brumimicrobium aurantiacum]|uniref:Biotin transporter n=1 Tax=Brumimicrobium aurantiacum TaxID=1737063 RepID=A0A3E1EXB5_9FLAO|nr:biotin transporter BioY [Brumimicrobium aurantiacum]RFC54210.1 biotin transporter BioY [Brumimicrobium aurantiacum]
MESSIRIFIGLIFIILFTQIQIDIELLNVDIPITGQTFAVLLVAYVFGLKDGTISILLYLLIGLVGLPIFADGGNGINAFKGNSGGYLIGFLFGGIITALLSEKWSNTISNALITALLGTLIILLCGVTRLAFSLGISDAILYGFNPFVLGGLVKILLGGTTGWLLKKYVI